MSETRAVIEDPYERMVAETKRLSREALLAGLDEDLGIALVNFEINSIRAQLQEKPAAPAS